MVELSIEEREYYDRHLLLNEVGVKGQLRLKAAKVLVIGAGGLGCPLLLYLAAAGIGEIGIVDKDVVDRSNLHRQILFGWNDVGVAKVDIAERRLQELNPFVKVKTYQCLLNSSNALDFIKDYDLVVDATDNFTTKYVLNDASYFLKKPLVYASLSQFEGQLSVFNAIDPATGELGPNYRDLFPEPPPSSLRQNCSEAGVIGALPGLLGCLQANEVIKIIAGIGEPLCGKLLLINALDLSTHLLTIKKQPSNALSGKHPTILVPTDNDVLCELERIEEQFFISALDLEKIFLSGQEIQLIDVRNQYEHDSISIGGKLIPLNYLPLSLHLINRNKFTVIYCKSGMRSQRAFLQLSQLFEKGQCVSLKGGIDAYILEGCQSNLKKCN